MTNQSSETSETAGTDDAVNAPNQFAGIADASEPLVDGDGNEIEQQQLPDMPDDERPASVIEDDVLPAGQYDPTTDHRSGAADNDHPDAPPIS